MTSISPMPVGVNARLGFHCPGCGRELIAGLEVAGLEAPCPSCGTIVQAPILGTPPAPAPAPPSKVDSIPERHGGRIRPDGNLDQRHIQKREDAGLLRIILSVGLVLAICAVVVLVLRSHFSG